MVLPLDRRRPGHPRLPVRIPAVIESIGSPGPAKPGEAQNLSPGGLLLRVGQGFSAFNRRDPVRVTLRPSHRPPLTLTGTVAWVQADPDVPGWALGVQFGEELPAAVVAEIADAEYPPWNSSAPDKPSPGEQ